MSATKAMKVANPASPHDLSRSALAEAIAKRDAVERELEAAKAAIEAAYQNKWGAQARLEALREQKMEAPNIGELFTASVAAGQPCGVDLLERPQSSADEDALEHEIKVWSKARQEVEASIPDKERALSWANFNVDDAVRDAVNEVYSWLIVYRA